MTSALLLRRARAGVLGLAVTSSALLGTIAPQTRSFADLSIEELLNEPVTSVSRKETSLLRSPAAIAVLNDKDLFRWGINTLPETLRLVPSLNVARILSNQWAISSRGFNGQFAGKLLVLMDGRTLYTPSFSGVHWDVQDTMLADLERIEVIRGPGATLWGANAVNGVINISTKNAASTQGTLISSTWGHHDGVSGAVRYGGAVTPELYYRVYVKATEHAELVDAHGHGIGDGWNLLKSGFRADWRPVAENLLTVQGDVYRGRGHDNVLVPTFLPPFTTETRGENRNRGANLLGRWTHTASDTSHFSAQAYFDHFIHQGGLQRETRNTADFEFEHRFRAGSAHDVIWGFGYRFSSDKLPTAPLVTWTPANRDLRLAAAFLQDEIALAPDLLHLTLGSKFEHHTYTGLEIQPGVRVLWTPTTRQSVWASASRAVATPARYHREAEVRIAPVAIEGGLTGFPLLLAASDAQSETLTAFELGYRAELRANVSLDVTAFRNVYRRVSAPIYGAPRFETDPAPHLLLPLQLSKVGAGNASGVELAIQWRPTERWHITTTYSHLGIDWKVEDPSMAANPKHQASLHARFEVTPTFEVNLGLRYVHRILTQHAAGAIQIPAYTALDAGFVWHASDALDVGIWGRNLLDPRHPEFTTYNTSVRAEVPRTLSIRATWRF